MRGTWILAAAVLVAIPAQGAKAPVVLDGTGWYGYVSELLSVKGFGKDSSTVGFGITFGANTWSALDGEDYEASGSYTVSGSKAIAIHDEAGVAELERAIEEWIEEYTPDSVTVHIIGQVVTAGKVKAKDGVLIAMGFKSKVAFSVTDGSGTSYGTLKSKAVLLPGL
jgi:hypothetical protein